jgi:hypothetical protein
MKKNDLIAVVVAGIIFLVAGYLVYTQVMPHNTSSTSTDVKVEKVGIIKPGLNQNTLDTMTDASKTNDYYTDIDLTTGLNNTNLFGQ